MYHTSEGVPLNDLMKEDDEPSSAELLFFCKPRYLLNVDLVVGRRSISYLEEE